MASQAKNATRKRGRPAIGKGVQIVVRSRPEFVIALDHWREAQKDQPNRPEAIRRLVELGLGKRK